MDENVRLCIVGLEDVHGTVDLADGDTPGGHICYEAYRKLPVTT